MTAEKEVDAATDFEAWLGTLTGDVGVPGSVVDVDLAQQPSREVQVRPKRPFQGKVEAAPRHDAVEPFRSDSLAADGPAALDAEKRQGENQ
jgi:hypothetical protein